MSRVTQVPAIPDIPTSAPEVLKDWMRAVKLALEVRLGRAGDPLDAAVTARELVSTSVVAVRPSASGRNITLTAPPEFADILGSYDPTTDYTTPAAPTGLRAGGAVQNILLTWDSPTYKNHAYTEVWRAATDNRGVATLVGTASDFIYTDPVGPGAGFYYWTRFKTQAGVYSDYNALPGVGATTSHDPASMIALLSAAGLTGANSLAPFVTLPAPVVVNGVTVPAGTYMRQAWIANGCIGTAQLGLAVVDTLQVKDGAITNAKVSNLDAGSITTGSLTAGVMSGNIVSALSGKFATLSALTSSLGIVQIDTAGYLRTSGVTSYSSGAGVFLGYDAGAYKMRVGDWSNTYLAYDGSTLTIKGNVQVLDVSGNVVLAAGVVPWGKISGTPGPGGRNMLRNSARTRGTGNDDLFGFYTNAASGWAGTEAGHGYNEGSWALTSGSSRVLWAADGPVTGRICVMHTNPQLVPVAPGTRYEFSALSGSLRAAAQATVWWLNSSYGGISTSSGTIINDEEKSGGPTLADWKRIGGFAVAPAGAAWAYLEVGFYSQKAAWSYCFLDQLYFGEADENQTSFSPWSDSSNYVSNTNQLADGAGLGTTASWGGVSGAGKPQDNATVGAAVGTNLTAGGSVVSDIVSDVTPITTTNQGTFISSLQIGNGATSNITINTSQLVLDALGNANFKGSLTAAYGTLGALTVASGGNIKSGQTAYNTGVGFWLGSSGGVTKLSIGDPAGNHINYDGTNFDITAHVTGQLIQSFTVTSAGSSIPNSWTTVLSQTLTTQGATVDIYTAAFQANGTTKFRLLRDGVQLWQISSTGNFVGNVWFTYAWLDSPSPGSHTYQFQAYHGIPTSTATLLESSMDIKDWR